jgi:hypothetical protein
MELNKSLFYFALTLISIVNVYRKCIKSENMCEFWSRDTHINDIQRNDIQHNDIQHKK